MLPYNDISTEDTDYIVSAIGDDQDVNWELKVGVLSFLSPQVSIINAHIAYIPGNN